jgi:hypothetical protein
MKVFAAVCETAVLGEADAVLGDETGVLDDAGGVLGAVEEADVATVVVGVIDADEAAGLPDELHAVTNTAAHPRVAQTATCLARCEFVVHMISNPFNSVSGSASHITSTTPAAPPRLRAAVRTQSPLSVRHTVLARGDTLPPGDTPDPGGPEPPDAELRSAEQAPRSVRNTYHARVGHDVKGLGGPLGNQPKHWPSPR